LMLHSTVKIFAAAAAVTVIVASGAVALKQHPADQSAAVSIGNATPPPATAASTSPSSPLASRVATDSPSLIASLPNGIKISFVGLGQTDANGHTLWHADGSQLSGISSWPFQGVTVPPNTGKVINVVAAVTPENLDLSDAKWQGVGAGNIFIISWVNSGATIGADCLVDSTATELHLRLTFSTVPWQTAVTLFDPETSASNGGEVINAPQDTSRGVVVTAVDTHNDWSINMKMIMPDGSSITPTESTLPRDAPVRTVTATFANKKLGDFKSIQLIVRPRNVQIDFQHLAARPGVSTIPTMTVTLLPDHAPSTQP